MGRWQLSILLPFSFCALLGLVCWLGLRLARQERMRIESQYRQLLAIQLSDIDQQIGAWLERRRQRLLEVADEVSLEAGALRHLVRTNPEVDQVFVVDRDGSLVHPSPAESLNRAEATFLTRIGDFLGDKELAAKEEAGGGRPAAYANWTTGSSNSDDGWKVWYWGRGLNLIFWRRFADGRVLGIALPRSRWMADLIASLPATEPASETGDSLAARRLRLVDAQGDVVYQWGDWNDRATTAVAVQSVAAPLSAWRLEHHLPQNQLDVAGRTGHFNLLAGLGAALLGLGVLAAYVCREQARGQREALQRVNFVNQVSHELRTPLTNIRLYAELLEAELERAGDENHAARRRLGVIVAESERLSRLIGNVLTLAQQQRGKLTIHPRPLIPDELVAEIVERFEPSLNDAGIKVKLASGAGREAWLDADAMQQMLGNLLSNVEKYAADSGHVEVVSEQPDGDLIVTVSDQGPGVAAGLEHRVFDPFRRGSERLESAAGAGIGLTIARQLARLHGGELSLLPSRRGACFQLRVKSLRQPTGDAR